MSTVEGNTPEVPATATMQTEAKRQPSIVRGFVFKSVFGDDPELCRELIEISLDTKIQRIEIVQPEREVAVLDDHRAGRLDVYAVDSDGNRYDVEIQASSRKDEWLRARHYQALMDVAQLRKGTEVKELRGSIVIFICDFDPFGDDWYVYDCQTVCFQTGRAVPDGRRMVLLNAQGNKGDISPSLRAFLEFVSGRVVGGDRFVDAVRATIEALVADTKWMEAYMDFEDELEAERLAAREQGYREGVSQGLSQGLSQGISQGLSQGRGEARLEDAAKLVREGVMGEGDAASFLGVDPAELRRALGAAS